MGSQHSVLPLISGVPAEMIHIQAAFVSVVVSDEASILATMVAVAIFFALRWPRPPR